MVYGVSNKKACAVLLATGIVGYFAYTNWKGYQVGIGDYSAKMSQLDPAKAARGSAPLPMNRRFQGSRRLLEGAAPSALSRGSGLELQPSGGAGQTLDAAKSTIEKGNNPHRWTVAASSRSWGIWRDRLVDSVTVNSDTCWGRSALWCG